MRIKEFKNIIDKMPDDTEIVVRALLHEPNKITKDDTVTIESFNIVSNDMNSVIILNPIRKLRGMTWRPEDRTLVLCENCVSYPKISNCKKKDNDCFECNTPCRCRLCNTEDIKEELMFSKRPMWEKKI